MEFNFKGSGDGFDVRLKVKWLSVVALCKAAAATVTALLVGREVAQLGSLLGWW